MSQIPSDYGICSTSNIKDLIAFKSPIVIPYDPFEDTLLASLANPIPDHIGPTPRIFQRAHSKYIIDIIYDEQIIFNMDAVLQ